MAERVESAERMPDQTGAAVAPVTDPETPWRGGFAGPFSSIQLAAQRLGRSWRLLLAVELGMLIAVALLATAPFYSDLVAGAQLQSVLTSAAPTDRNIQISVTVPSLYDPQTSAESRLSTLDTTVNGDVTNTVGPVTSGQSGSTEILQAVNPLALTKVNGTIVTTALPKYHAANAQDLAMSFDYAKALPYMKLLAGRTPNETTPGADPEVMVTPAMGAKPGDILHFVDGTGAKLAFDARVVGVWFPRDETDPYWNGLRFDTIIVPNINNPPPTQYPVMFSRPTLLRILSAYKPHSAKDQMGVIVNYVYYVNANTITVAQAPDVQGWVKALRSALDVDVPGISGAAGVSVGTSLSALIGSVSNVLSTQTLPLYSVDAELVALALLFIFIMAGLLIESQASEITTLKSRGASTPQILLTYLSQGILLAAVALSVGVIAAGGLALALVRFFVPLNHAVFSTLTPAYAARSLSLRHALIPASIGAGLGVVALALASWQAARMDALAFRREQGRSERLPFWKRYYLDIGLAALCIAGYTELVTFGGLTTRTLVNAQTGASQQPGGQADLIQLLAPTLLLLAGTLLLQRITPPLLRFGAWLTARGRGATGMLAFAQVSRASGMFSRLTLLLTLAVGLGLFALTFQTTIAQGAHDDAYYLVGGDERVSIEPQMEGTQSTLGYAAAFAKMPGVERVSPMYRGITLTLPNQGGQNVGILGVDPTTFAQTTTAWRSDYASQSLPTLMNIIERSKHGPSMGMANTPMVALVDQTFANTFALRVGSRFQLSPQEAGEFSTATSAYFVVGAIVNDFPSLYDEYGTGYIIVDLNDYLGALANPNVAAYTVNGPNDFLLRTTADPSAAAKRAKALEDPNFFVQQTYDARALTTTYRADPVSAGMSGLLLLGALIAALLALVGVITQAAIAARRRQTQFAILRTLGLSGGALIRMLLAEQALVYLLGALGGVAIGALLSVASLPFLGFTTSTYTPPVIGVPPSQPAINFTGSLLFMAALLVIFIAALIVAGAVARAVGLGRALRVGED